MSKPAKTQGVHHIGLTVGDLSQACRFFIDVLGFSQVGEKPAYPAVFVSDGSIMLTLWQAEDPSAARAFDRKTAIGLHHLALRVPDLESLETLHKELSETADTEIEFAPEPLGTSGLHHMMTRIPGGIRIEFITTPS